MRPRAPLWKKLLLAATSVVVTLGGLELAAHAWDYAQYGTYHENGQPVGLYVRDGNPEPRLQPGARLSGLFYSVSVNSRGIRGPELAVPKPRGTTRIWCVGGSTTFDIYASDDAHTWPAVAERHLNDLLPGRRFELINGGVPGDILQGSANKLSQHGRELEVDYVLVYHGPNDIRAVSGAQSVVPQQPLVHLRILELLHNWSAARGFGTGHFPDRTLDNHTREGLVGRLRQVERAIQGLRVQPIYATHALRIAPEAEGASLRQQAGELPRQLQMSAASARAWYDSWNAVMEDRARAQRTPLVDVRAAVGPDPALWGDATHFSDAGADVAGRAVAETLAAYFKDRPH